ncbi:MULTISPECIES: TetR/AcrR family transcriptional regulator [Rhodobacterales]|jgi:AcrR family transcriptional regulator|uniref:TetR family transcriptional regulator n=1 Tax=Phaeobacter gallaeciensis TaxID=60890 RepID=A0A1B0ZUV9_9RHOB|nr:MULTISPECIES: TetR/AcrR family transcriptional regulator [Phaeobacter]MDF1773153.1 TetR/AcrR family transcriptional regulator [Pseudophaeobacter sp. bin_em_oilr2.035]MEE2633751.1 TetR/AcrR family transcriptional regulator [Pseudomonadota bacterium]ANP37955.1 TetR family transcriptional regulator [Phaeobacter gallaeciensis]MDE4060596.1 TetR/AcrR family transcriptional regulator [Phaeobacter gallaeciensis]MDE4123600.1 TetR/AcrR family transcriptional regulator [Phaeobacter gallaeciensis]
MRPNKRDELVRKALDVFYRNGFHATGMDKLVSETGVSKTSMYKHFRTKEDLILAVLRLRDENFRHWLYRRIEELSDTPKGQMLALFDALSEWFTKPEFRGCMFIKASAEFQEINHPIHAQSAAHKQILQDHFSEIAEAADANDPRLLARQLLLLKEGAIVSAVLARGGGLAGDPAADAKEAARGLIDLQIPST